MDGQGEGGPAWSWRDSSIDHDDTWTVNGWARNPDPAFFQACQDSQAESLAPAGTISRNSALTLLGVGVDLTLPD